MSKASEVASELRKLADSLDREPDAELATFRILVPHHGEGEKAAFLNSARLLPRPYDKKWEPNELELRYESSAMTIRSYIPRSIICELVEPAKPAVYRCDPILSEAEEAALETAVAE